MTCKCARAILVLLLYGPHTQARLPRCGRRAGFNRVRLPFRRRARRRAVRDDHRSRRGGDGACSGGERDAVTMKDDMRAEAVGRARRCAHRRLRRSEHLVCDGRVRARSRSQRGTIHATSPARHVAAPRSADAGPSAPEALRLGRSSPSTCRSGRGHRDRTHHTRSIANGFGGSVDYLLGVDRQRRRKVSRMNSTDGAIAP